MNLTVVGTGYVGLVAGACFASSGHNVFCTDIDEEKIRRLQSKKLPIYEPGLLDLVEMGIRNDHLHFSTSTASAVKESEFVFLAVHTPNLPEGQADLRPLQSAATEISKNIQKGTIVVNKSTIPIGTHRQLQEWVTQSTSYPVEVVINPEFLKEGSAVQDFLKPDRVIIGTDNVKVFNKLKRLYAPFTRHGNPVIQMSPMAAEMTKYACNSFLATRISFMNELSWLCDSLGVDIEDIRQGMTADARIGRHFLYAGVGYGGSCFPKDVRALLDTAKNTDIPLGVVQAAQLANERQQSYIVNKVDKYFSGSISGKTFAVWGLSFKPNTDDMREAPSVRIIEQLLQRGAKVRAYDPVAMEKAKGLLDKSILFSRSCYDAADQADAVILVTEWDELRDLDFKQLKRLMKTPIIFDGRNVYDPNVLKEEGFTYFGVGR